MTDFHVEFHYNRAAARPVGDGYTLRPSIPLTGVTLHSTEGQPGSTFAGECMYMRDSPVASTHYIISKDGRIERILDVIWRAWHAGTSSWRGRPDCNDYMVGVELHHSRGDGAYPQVQMDALHWLLLELLHDHPTILLENIVAHRWVALPPGRKSDPVGWIDNSIHSFVDDLSGDVPANPAAPSDDRPILSAPSISPIMFELVLRRANSPVLDERPALEYYKALVQAGVDPAFWLAVFGHENEYGTNNGPCPSRKNSGCVRTPEDASLSDRVDNGFAVYPSWINSVIDWGKRMTGPKYAGMTVREAIAKYAPASDGNTPDSYADDVLWKMAQWQMLSRWGG